MYTQNPRTVTEVHASPTTHSLSANIRWKWLSFRSFTRTSRYGRFVSILYSSQGPSDNYVEENTRGPVLDEDVSSGINWLYRVRCG